MYWNSLNNLQNGNRVLVTLRNFLIIRIYTYTHIHSTSQNIKLLKWTDGHRPTLLFPSLLSLSSLSSNVNVHSLIFYRHRKRSQHRDLYVSSSKISINPTPLLSWMITIPTLRHTPFFRSLFTQGMDRPRSHVPRSLGPRSSPWKGKNKKPYTHRGRVGCGSGAFIESRLCGVVSVGSLCKRVLGPSSSFSYRNPLTFSSPYLSPCLDRSPLRCRGTWRWSGNGNYQVWTDSTTDERSLRGRMFSLPTHRLLESGYYKWRK